MVDLSITAANVQPGANATIERGTAGETVSAGMVAYRSASTGRLGRADSNAAGADVKIPVGIFLNGAANGQPVTIQTAGDITIGATLTPGSAYYLSETAAGIQPAADVGSGEGVALLGLAKSASVLALDIQVPGVTL